MSLSLSKTFFESSRHLYHICSLTCSNQIIHSENSTTVSSKIPLRTDYQFDSERPIAKAERRKKKKKQKNGTNRTGK